MNGVALMILASGFFAGMSALVKALGPEFPFAEAAMFRALLGLPIILAMMWQQGLSLRPKRPVLMVLRGVLGLTAMICYYYALQRGLLANMTVVSRFQPVLIALLAPLLLRERLTRLALAAVAISMGGVLLIVRPAPAALDPAALVALGGAFASALAHLIVRRLGASDHPLVTVAFFCIIITAGGGLLSLPVFVWPDARQLGMLTGVALCATAGQLLMTMAYARDRAQVVSAASYSSVVYALIIGFAFWNERPDALALTGAAVIVGAGILLLLRTRPLAPEPES